MAEPLTVPDDLPAITTPEEVRAAFGPEARGPHGEPMNLTALAIDALSVGAPVRAVRIGGEPGIEVTDPYIASLTARTPVLVTIEVV